MNPTTKDKEQDLEIQELTLELEEVRQAMYQLTDVVKSKNISFQHYLIIVKILLAILLGLNFNSDMIQFDGDVLLPIIESLATTEAVN